MVRREERKNVKRDWNVEEKRPRAEGERER